MITFILNPKIKPNQAKGSLVWVWILPITQANHTYLEPMNQKSEPKLNRNRTKN